MSDTTQDDIPDNLVFDSVAEEYREKSDLTEQRLRYNKRDANRGTRV
jgi:hypothetical protein